MSPVLKVVKTNELEEHIHELIALNGPLNLAQFMGLALGHPTEGYYNRKDPFGVTGDFTTSPEISQLFGEMVGVFMADYWQQLGCPEDVAIVELGPGRGTLMRDFLRATKNVPDFHRSIEIHLVEMSPLLRQKQHELLDGESVSVEWHLDIGDLPDKPLFVIANEFFDALPIHQFVNTNEGWRERMIGIKAGKLQFMQAPASTLAHAHIDVSADAVDEEAILEVCPAATTVVNELSEKIKSQGGVMLAIDYGYETPAYKDTLQALKKHAFHNPLEDAGEADITAHVNFEALSKAAAQHGARSSTVVTQRDFLLSMGINQRAQILMVKASPKEKLDIETAIARLIDPNDMGSLFKCLAITDGKASPSGF